MRDISLQGQTADCIVALGSEACALDAQTKLVSERHQTMMQIAASVLAHAIAQRRSSGVMSVRMLDQRTFPTWPSSLPGSWTWAAHVQPLDCQLVQPQVHYLQDRHPPFPPHALHQHNLQPLCPGSPSLQFLGFASGFICFHSNRVGSLDSLNIKN